MVVIVRDFTVSWRRGGGKKIVPGAETVGRNQS